MSKPAALASFPVPTAEEDLEAEEESEEADEEVHRDEDVSIRVTQSPGYLCHIEATAAFRMPAQTLFKQVVTHPDNAAIFRHMDRCSYRRVLEDDGAGRRRVAVQHEASWRLLMLHGKFTTKLLVEEDARELTMDFQLDPATGSGGGIMKRFHGRWHVRPHPADPEHASLSTLDQDLALGIYLPPPFDRILKRISCSQVKAIFEDVKRETDNVNRGQPTLCPWQEVRDKQIGVEEAAAEGQGEGQEKGDDSQAAAEAAEGAAAAALPEAAGGGTLPAEAAVSANP